MKRSKLRPYTIWALGALLLLNVNIGAAQCCTAQSSGYDKPQPIAPEGYSILVEDLSDEFNGESLDMQKWRNETGRGGWNGRGADYRRTNTFIKDGLLNLRSSVISEKELGKLYAALDKAYAADESLRFGKDLDVDEWDPAKYGPNGWVRNWGVAEKDYQYMMQQGLKSIGAATLISRKFGSCGYYEARIKVSGLAMSSAFWLQGDEIEYDITETIGAYSHDTQEEYVTVMPYTIGTSVWVNDGIFRGKGGVPGQRYTHDKPLREEFIVFGLKWEPTLLTVYINDREVYNFPLENRVTEEGNIPIPVEIFTSPQQVIFDTEILLGPDSGWPSKAQLEDPTINTFYVDWVRVWVKEDAEWAKEPMVERFKENTKNL
ncbi:MAG: family 16 glycosylhydrolase [Rikenellaceae bacterium]